jgi:hypothetical protein
MSGPGNGFNSDQLERPPSPHELRARDKAFKALTLWVQTGSESEVAKHFKITKESARVLINKGVALYEDRRSDLVARLRIRQQVDLDAIRAGWMPTAGTDRSSAEINFKRLEVESKLQGLNAEKERDAGPQIIVVSDSTPAEWGWAPARGRSAEVVEGEIVPDELEPPSDHTGDQKGSP